MGGGGCNVTSFSGHCFFCLFFVKIFFCTVVAMCDLVHNLETIFDFS